MGTQCEGGEEERPTKLHRVSRRIEEMLAGQMVIAVSQQPGMELMVSVFR
jgi:hypothetical protein